MLVQGFLYGWLDQDIVRWNGQIGNIDELEVLICECVNVVRHSVITIAWMLQVEVKMNWRSPDDPRNPKNVCCLRHKFLSITMITHQSLTLTKSCDYTVVCHD